MKTCCPGWLLLLVPLIYCKPAKVTVEDGEGFVLRIAHYKGYEDFITCEVHRGGETINLSSDKEDSYSLKSGETLTRLFHTVHECGVRVQEATKASAGEWRLIIYIADGSFTSEPTEVHVLPKPEPKCPESTTNYCFLAAGSKKTYNCNVSGYNRSDTCHYATAGAMELKRADLDRQIDLSPNNYKGRMFEVEQSTILSCQAPPPPTGYPTGHQKCRIAHMPMGRYLNIEDGLQHSRYSAFKTDLKTGLCQLEIPHPIGEDAGSWEMLIWDREYHVCHFKLFDMDRFKRDFEEKASTPEVVNMLQSDHSVRVTCAKDMPYAISRCYFQLQNGIIMADIQEELSGGTCEMFLHEREIGSTVTCGFNGLNRNDPDFIRRFSIEKHESELELKKIEKNVLQCRHVFGEPLQDCLFESPSRQIYSLPSDTFASDAFSYHNADGQKLKNGFCTIAISLLPKESLEEGVWRCVATKGGQTLQREINICPDCQVNLVLGQ